MQKIPKQMLPDTSIQNEQKRRRLWPTVKTGTIASDSALAYSSMNATQQEDYFQQLDLEPCAIDDGIQSFLKEQSDLAPSTQTQYESALGFFARWCAKQGIEELNQLTPQLLLDFKYWRQYEAPTKVRSLKQSSIKSQIDKIRSFIRFCETVGTVRPGLHEVLTQIQLREGEGVSADVLDPNKAELVLEHLEKWNYAQREHVIWTLMTECGARAGDARSLDVEDVLTDLDPPRVHFKHRPETGTRLKNGVRSERLVFLSEQACRILTDYTENRRHSIVDEYGRNPLLTSQFGRLSLSAIRSCVYRWTRPCKIGLGCPHGVEISECSASHSKEAYRCPSSQSSHAIRKSYITYNLLCGIDSSHISGRCDVSEAVLSRHYDHRTLEGKMEVRKEAFENAWLAHRPFGGKTNGR